MQKHFLLCAGGWAALLLGGLSSHPAAAQPKVAIGAGHPLHIGPGSAEVYNTKGVGLNLRKGPGTGFAPVASLPDGTVVDVVGAMRNSFWRIKARGITGWGRADFLRQHLSPAVSRGTPVHVDPVPTSGGQDATGRTDGTIATGPNISTDPVLSTSPVQEPAVAAASSYLAALAQAKSATSPDEIRAASVALSALLPVYPQDVDIPLQLGWLLFRATHYTAALHSYELALSRSTPGSEAELGVAWSLLRLGRCGEAQAHFQAVLLRAGAESTATEGLRQCTAPPVAAAAPAAAAPAAAAPAAAPAVPAVAVPGPAPKVWVQPAVAQSFFIYANHPTISYAAAPLVRLEALLKGRYYGAVAYRYSYFATHDKVTAPWSQHDLYVDAGLTSKSGGATLHYALIADGSGYSGTTNHIGLSARYSHGFDSLFNLTASMYSDAPVVRGELAFFLPIIGGFGLRPGGALQWTPTELFKTLSLTMSYYHRYFSLWLGAKVGDEKRPAYLDVTYVYNSPARIPYGVWAGAAIRPGAKFTLTLGYSFDRLLRNDTTPVQDSQVHALTLGLAREF